MVKYEFMRAHGRGSERCWPGYDLGFTPTNVYGKEVFILGDNREENKRAAKRRGGVAKKKGVHAPLPPPLCTPIYIVNAYHILTILDTLRLRSYCTKK